MEFDSVLLPIFEAKRTKRFSALSLVDFRPVKPVEVCLNLEDTYTNRIVTNALKRRSEWVTVIPPSALDDAGKDKTKPVTVYQFCDFERIDWVPVMSGRHHAASYLVRKGLSRKAQLSLQIRRYASKHPTSILCRAAPFTVILETWDAHEEDVKMDFGGVKASFGNMMSMSQTSTLRERLGWCLTEAKSEVEDPSREHWFWILKPSYTNKGSDIAICGDWNEVVQGLLEVPDIREWVLQRYIERPLLLNGHKFHLRVYVLCVGALKVYVYDDILALLAAQKYDMSDTGPDSVYRHLTNTARSCEDVNFDEEKFVKTLDDLPFYLRLPGGQAAAETLVQDVRSQVHDITGELFAAFENEYTVFAPMENCFELYGLDFMIDEGDDDAPGIDVHGKGARVTLLETNPGPDFKQTGQRLRGVIVRLFENTCRVVLDGRDESPCFTKVYEKNWSVKKTGGGMKFN
jgi:tubulin---tyrosine ligase